jgi:hypothetical protein
MSLGRMLIVLGIAAVAVGLVVEFVPSIRLGRLPGDLSFGGDNWRIYLPIGTSVLLSLFLTLLFALVNRR